MALHKSITLPNESAGNHIRIRYYNRDDNAKECSAHFYLYVNSSTPANKPLVLIGKLRLKGAKFDEYLSTAALAALPTPGPDPTRTALYLAAKAGEPMQAGGELTDAQLDLTDATDV